MKNVFKSAIIFTFIALSRATVFAQSPVIPQPLHYMAKEGKLDLTTLQIDTTQISSNVINYFVDNLKEYWGVGVQLVNKGGNVIFQNSHQNTETYLYDISDSIFIGYSTESMAFAAVNTLLQLIVEEESQTYVNYAIGYDAPRYSWRGLHLDVSRHFFTVQEVKRFIDLMALYKFNKFHWHLTDDQGWRIEIKKYPLLTEIGGFRDSTIIGHYSDSPRKWDPKEYGGFYTQDEIKEVVQYASERYIDVIPEIEMPGHSRAALAAYPEFSCTSELNPVPGLWGIFDDIYCSKPETIEFLQNVLTEVLDLFPSEYIHIGGDEAPKTRWKECEKCQRIMSENQLVDEHELQSYFIQQMDSFLTSHNRKLIGWDEILEGGLSENAAVMSWRGEEGGIVAAKLGHEVVMSPTTYCYFDYYQGTTKEEPLAIGGYLPLEKIFSFYPVPMELSQEEGAFVLGGQANLWTEYIPTMQHLEYMTYPRALALSQVLWCDNRGDYKDFLQVLIGHQEDLLKRFNVNYAMSIHYPKQQIIRTKKGIGMNFSSPDFTKEFLLCIKGVNDVDLWQSVNQLDMIFFDRNEEKEFFYITLKDSSHQFELDFEQQVHGNLGIPVEMVTLPHPKYDHNGSLNLVDGISGTMPWKGSEWLGFDTSTIQLILDAKGIKGIQGMKIGILENNGSWIYLPEKLTVECSRNKKKWKEIGSTDINSLAQTDGKFSMPFIAKKRFIRLTIKAMDVIPDGKDGAGNVPWTFIDEIEFTYTEDK